LEPTEEDIALIKQDFPELTEEEILDKDDKSDAFRHAIWCIVMAKEGVGLKNAKMNWARDFSS
jgi:hypothetical protein